jgi:hypothetical protein
VQKSARPPLLQAGNPSSPNAQIGIENGIVIANIEGTRDGPFDLFSLCAAFDPPGLRK